MGSTAKRKGYTLDTAAASRRIEGYAVETAAVSIAVPCASRDEPTTRPRS